MLLIPNSKRVIYHFGRWDGFNAAFARLIDEKVTIIILGNKYNTNIYKTASKAYNLFGDYDQNRNNKGDDSEEYESLTNGTQTGSKEKTPVSSQPVARLK